MSALPDPQRRRAKRGFRDRLAALAWGGLVLASTLYLGGFLVYIAEYQRAAEPAFDKADAIVVLTGGPDRIAEAARLLAEHHAGSLLISGVNEQTDEGDLVRIVPGLAPFMKCCVTIDQTAQNTHENAVSTRVWMTKNKINSILLVTSHAHLPRALFEFRTSGGADIKISPWRVGGPPHPEDWWHDPAVIRAMLVEYTKMTGAVLRYIYVSMKADVAAWTGFAPE